jgi:hypothetical protein
VDDAFQREDVDAILSGVFDMNAKLAHIDENLAQITSWLENGDDDEQEEDEPLAPDP